MRVAFLTSSRADYSIYLPLIKRMQADADFAVSAIVFGTHLSRLHGYTIDQIRNDHIPIDHELETVVLGDSPDAVNLTVGLTMIKFSGIWSSSTYDLIFALGDRLEMFAAVMATLPFNLPVAHLYGGETTLGAIDNVYRHAISLTAKYHFVSTEQYRKRLAELIGTDINIFNVGSLSVENILGLPLYDINTFNEIYNIDLSTPTVLCTFHPETISYANNIYFTNELLSAISMFSEFQFLITLPNTDTMGNYIRCAITDYSKSHDNVIAVDSLGTVGYLSAMKHCLLVLGNSSSGFVEASVFPKKVVNVGDRQKGRIVTDNIYSSTIERNAIAQAIQHAISMSEPNTQSIYGDGHSSTYIVNTLKSIIK